MSLALRAVRRVYGDFDLGPLDLEAGDGELVAILGPSGAGKTSILRLAAGLDAPDDGRVLLDGRDVTSVPTERRGLALVFQDGALFPHLDVARNVAFGLAVRGVDAARARARVDEALALVGLAGLGPRRVQTLSGGERSRVALGRALAPILADLAPRVLLLDEPFSALDRPLREELRRVVSALHRRLGLTTLLVTHDREEALQVADRLVLVSGGRVAEQGPARALHSAPRTAFAARFLGVLNVLEADEATKLGGPARGEGPVGLPHAAVRPVPGDAWVVLESGWPTGRAVLARDGSRVVALDPAGRLVAGERVGVEFAWNEARTLAR